MELILFIFIYLGAIALIMLLLLLLLNIGLSMQASLLIVSFILSIVMLILFKEIFIEKVTLIKNGELKEPFSSVGIMQLKITGVMILIFIGIHHFVESSKFDYLNGFYVYIIPAVIPSAVIEFLLIGVLLKNVYDRKKKHLIQYNKDNLIKEFRRMINKKQEILQTIDDYFINLESYFYLISLISLCTGSDEYELKKRFFDSQDGAFTSTKKVIFNRLSDDEKKDFLITLLKL